MTDAVLLDVCLPCRIQAEHQPGRVRCPRCGGALVVLDAHTRHRVEVPRPGSVTLPSATAPDPGVGAGIDAVRSRAPGAGRLGWVAHRPLDTLPPRPQPKAPVDARTPRYLQMPQWGLHDVPARTAEVDEPQIRPEAALRRALRWTAILLAAAAAAQFLRYLTLLVNRSRPIPYWFDVATAILLIGCGVAALSAVVWAVYAFARWLLSIRERSYELAGTREPRHRLVVVAASVVPFANVIGAPFLLLEAASAVDGAAGPARRAINRGAVAWGLVSLVGVIALSYRIVALTSESIQVGADAMIWSLLTLIASAAFARWLGPRLSAMTVMGGDTVPVRQRRLVVAA